MAECNGAFVLGCNLTHVVKPAAGATMWNTNTRHTSRMQLSLVTQFLVVVVKTRRYNCKQDTTLKVDQARLWYEKNICFNWRKSQLLNETVSYLHSLPYPVLRSSDVNRETRRKCLQTALSSEGLPTKYAEAECLLFSAGYTGAVLIFYAT